MTRIGSASFTPIGTGSKNTRQVALIQKRLVDLGYKIDVDGDFGTETRQAVQDFQRKHALRVDGWVGEDTARALDIATPAPSVSGEWPHQRECMTYYGTPGSCQVQLIFPYRMLLADTGAVVHYCLCHEKIHDAAKRVLEKVHAQYGDARIHELGLDLFDGCLNVRKVRGGNTWSMHAWGIAFDFDASHNEMKWDHTEARFAKPDYVKWFEAWESEGFISLGRERDYDWMHVQAARL